MAKFQLMMRGENFIVSHDGKDRVTSFLTTIRVEADSVSAAEEFAVEKIRNREELISITKNAKENSPMLFLEEFCLLDDNESLETRGGYTWFSEDDETKRHWWQFWK